MHVEELKYLIWAQDMARAIGFYQTVFDAGVARRSEVMAELLIAGSTLGIHSGGEGKRTWTGLSFQVGDLFAACNLLRAAGGTVLRQPEDTPEEPAHLAMCADPEGNEIMLTILRQHYSAALNRCATAQSASATAVRLVRSQLALGLE